MVEVADDLLVRIDGDRVGLDLADDLSVASLDQNRAYDKLAEF